MQIFNFDIIKFPFREILSKTIAEQDLSYLHKIHNYDFVSKETEGKTIWHKLFDDNIDVFLPIYYDFIRSVIKPIHFPNETRIVVQKLPKLRIHLKNNIAMANWHRDRDSLHNLKSINFHLPFTDTNEQNCLWCETFEGKEDYTPFLLKYGQYIVFDGINLKHGNNKNTSEFTRVSMDFRIIRGSEFIDENKFSLLYKIPFSIGHYYIEM